MGTNTDIPRKLVIATGSDRTETEEATNQFYKTMMDATRMKLGNQAPMLGTVIANVKGNNSVRTKLCSDV